MKIAKAVFSGKELTSEMALKRFGAVKFSNRIRDIEDQYGVKVNRVRKTKKRNGAVISYNCYFLDTKRYAKAIARFNSDQLN